MAKRGFQVNKADWEYRANALKLFIETHKRRPSQYNASEKIPWTYIVQLQNRKYLAPDFTQWLLANYPTRRWGADNTKDEVLEFTKERGYRPAMHSKDPYEATLASSMWNYLLNSSSGGRMADLEFKKDLDDLCVGRREMRPGYRFASFVNITGDISLADKVSLRYYAKKDGKMLKELIKAGVVGGE